MKYYLILLSIFFSLIRVSDSGLSITYGDYIALGVLLFVIPDYLKSKYIFHRFSKYWFYYILILFFSALVNFTLLEGRFLNIFRTNFYSLVLFITIYNLIVRRKLSSKSFVMGIGILGVAFLFKTWPEMKEAWAISESEFTTVNIFESSLNLNTWGFSLLLFLIVGLYCWSTNLLAKISLVYSIILIIFIFFSYSRTAYSLTALVLFWSVFYVNRSNIKRLFLPVVILGALFLFHDQLNIFGFKISESAAEFFARKSESYGEDLVSTRFILINIKPILENFNTFNPLQILIGDGVSIQHSFVSHTLVVSGLLGFTIYIKRFWIAIKISITNVRLRQYLITSKYLIILIIVLLLNDFITNLSSFLPFSAYLSAVVMGFFFAKINYVQQDSPHSQTGLD